MGNRNLHGKIKEELEISRWETGFYMEKLKKIWSYQNGKQEFIRYQKGEQEFI